MSNIEKIEENIDSIHSWVLDYPLSVGYIPCRLLTISKLLLDELKDQRDKMTHLEKSMAELIGGDNDSND